MKCYYNNLLMINIIIARCNKWMEHFFWRHSTQIDWFHCKWIFLLNRQAKTIQLLEQQCKQYWNIRGCGNSANRSINPHTRAETHSWIQNQVDEYFHSFDKLIIQPAKNMFWWSCCCWFLVSNLIFFFHHFFPFSKRNHFSGKTGKISQCLSTLFSSI